MNSMDIKMACLTDLFKVKKREKRKQFLFFHYGCSASENFLALLLQFVIIVLTLCELINGEQSFEVSPKSTYVYVGESATLYCKVKDKVGVLYWEKDGGLLAIENTFYQSTAPNWAIFGDAGAGEYNLQIVSATEQDAGQYVCKVTPNSNGGANLTSEPATLWLSDLPPQDQAFPMCLMSVRDSLIEEYTVDFTCVIYDPNEAAELRWQRMADPLDIAVPSVQSSQNRYTMLKQTMTLTSMDHDSQYQCIYTSGAFTGSRSCSTGSLSVKHKPVISISPKLYSAQLGENAMFTCHLQSSFPEPSGQRFIWKYKNHELLPTENRFEFYPVGTESEQIVIKDINGGDDGSSVDCMVSNSIGISQATSMISVNLSSENSQLTQTELLRWIIPISVLVTALLLAIMLVIWLFDVCSCCFKKSKPRKYTWGQGSTDNLSYANARRGSDVSSLPTDYYLTRQIRTSSRLDSRSQTPHNRPPSQLNYSGGSQPIPVSPIPPSSPSPQPQQISTISHSPQGEDIPDGHLYRQRKTRGERDRDHVKQHQLRRKNTPHKNLVYADLDINDNSLQRNGRHSNGLSDSGLDFANSESVDSRSITPQERIVYAKIVRSNSSNPRYPPDADLRPPPGTAGNREVTREELADMLISS